MSTKDKSPPTMEDMRIAVAAYERHKGIMYRTAMRIVADVSEQDDVVHDALFDLAGRAEVLRTLDDRALAVYVAETTRYVALMHERRQRTRQHHLSELSIEEYGDLASGVGLEEELTERETRGRRLRYLREALAELAPVDRELLVWKYLDGDSDEAIGRRLGIKPGSVRSRLARARKRARALIVRKEAADDGQRQGI